MITTDAIRNLLAIADVAKNPYSVAAAAGSLLTADPSDAVALGHYLRALSALKLTAAAQRLVAKTEGTGGGGGGGIIPWASRARRFQANLSTLEKRTPAGAALVREAAGHLQRFELHQTTDGNFEVLEIDAGPVKGWLGGLADHRAAMAMWKFDKAATPAPPPIAFDGIGYGWLWRHVLETTARSYLQYSCAIYVIESDPLALAMLLHMQDWQELIAQPRVRWFIGPNALGDFRAAIVANPAWTIPGQFVRCALRPRPALDIEGTLQALQQSRHQAREQQQTAIQKYYTGKDARFWRDRFVAARHENTPQPLRVLGITSRFTTVLQHSMAELRSAVEAGAGMNMTCRMRVAIEPDDHSLENPFLAEIADFKPDLIVQLSRLRYENPSLPQNVPFLCWDQDNLPCMRTAQATASLNDRQTGPLTYIAGNGAIFGFGHLQWPERNCIFCHAAGATHRYAAAPAPSDLLAQHACDISYVSNASGSPESLAADLRRHWEKNPSWLAFFEHATAEILTASNRGTCWDDLSLAALMDPRAPAAGLEKNSAPFHEMKMDLHRYADRCLRHATLAWVSRWCLANGKTLRLYGRGWESHPDLARWAAGIAEPGEPLRAIYQASRINLQMIESGFIHSRSLDGLAAGGFFLTRHVPADGENPAALRDIHALGQWAKRENIQSPAALAQHADPAIRAQWARTLAFHPWSPEEALRVLKVWADVPAPAVAFPMLPDISFHDEATFAARAHEFLADEPRRRALADQMRQIVLHDFSYDSRWKQFLDHVTHGLRSAAQEL